MASNITRGSLERCQRGPIRNLSGNSYWPSSPSSQDALPDVYDGMALIGHRYGYALLAATIERASGLDFDDFV
jgi:hypothetical protein